jgi:outer membrane protein OmpA-like peptidoglycan-associated protein
MRKFISAGIAILLCTAGLFAQSTTKSVAPSAGLGTRYTLYYAGNNENFNIQDPEVLLGNQKAMQSVLSLLRNDPTLDIRIDGYANPIKGTVREQKKVLMPLSLHRAADVCRYFVLFGIARRRIKLNGFGGDYALTRSGDKSNGWLNRRVVLTICKF